MNYNNKSSNLIKLHKLLYCNKKKNIVEQLKKQEEEEEEKDSYRAKDNDE